jgi:hypothetical protein
MYMCVSLEAFQLLRLFSPVRAKTKDAWYRYKNGMGDSEWNLVWANTKGCSVGVYVLKFSGVLMVQNFEVISDILKEIEIIQRNHSTKLHNCYL